MTGLTFERTGPSTPSFNAPGPGGRGRGMAVSPEVLRSIHRHFAAASAQLARQEGLAAEQSAKYGAASAFFRSLIESNEGIQARSFRAGPLVEDGKGGSTLLVTLLIEACQSYGLALPLRSIDPDLLLEAKSLLSGLVWRLPDDLDEDGRGQPQAGKPRDSGDAHRAR